MPFSVISRRDFQNVRGYDDVKIKYEVCDENGNKLCVMTWGLLQGKPLVFDQKYDTDHISNYTWSVSTSGYAQARDVGYMHTLVAKLKGMEIPQGMSIDHINRCKLDNREINLRVATQSEQNSNRNTRSDKIPPCQKLVDNGITELPKYVRWDKLEEKFVIEKHPALNAEVQEGKRKKAVMSGSKSKSISIIEKYQDILARLQQLKDTLETDEFIAQREARKQEYAEICACIDTYENRVDPSQDQTPTPQIEAVRHTAPGKKTVSKLPDGCGVRPEDIPKFCYYKPETATRGDKFVIDKHPALLNVGKRQWSTTEKKSVSTKEKFEQMMEMYATL